MLPCSQMHFVILTNRILLRKGQISSASSLSLSLLQQDCCLVLPLSRKATPSNCELCDVGGLLFVLMQGIALRLLSVLAMYLLTPTFRALCATGPLVEELYPLQEMFAPQTWIGGCELIEYHKVYLKVWLVLVYCTSKKDFCMAISISVRLYVTITTYISVYHFIQSPPNSQSTRDLTLTSRSSCREVRSDLYNSSALLYRC